MEIPRWLLRIIISYLNSRSMIVRYTGLPIEHENLAGEAGQGALVGLTMINNVVKLQQTVWLWL